MRNPECTGRCQIPGTHRGNSYRIWQDATHVRIYESANNVATLRASFAAPNAAGQTHSYQVIYDPLTGKLQVWRDNTYLGSWTDTTPLTSGSYLSLRTDSADVRFDDLVVSEVIKYYESGGQRVAMRKNGAVSYLFGDHLGSTSVTANASGTRTGELWYKPWGESRGTPFGATPTTYRFTGQREDASVGLYYYGARYYDSALGRFIQPDTIVPNPGNPQSLNRYAYTLNNPLRYVDPSGYDPLDAAWQQEFRAIHGRDPTAEDFLIRLFSIAFPDEWNWSAFYDAEGNYIQGSLEDIFRDKRSANRSWANMPTALERLAGWYKAGEQGSFTRDIGSLFGGLANRLEASNAWSAVSNASNPIRVWVYLDREGLPVSLTSTSDKDANVHHWAWALTMGAEYASGGSFINTGREIQQFHGDWRNTWSDVNIGNRGAALGAHFRVLGLGDIRRAWNFFMLGRWF